MLTLKGHIDWYDHAQGRGVIRGEDESRFPFHFSALTEGQFHPFRSGHPVEFTIVPSTQKGYRTIGEVRPL